MADYYYYLGPWRWVVNEEEGESSGSWMAPENTVGSIDLRPIPDQAITIHGSKPYGLFATTEVLDSEYDLLGRGDIRDLTVTSQMQNIWKGTTGYRPNGTRLVDLLHDHLILGGDPDGLDFCRPLMPNRLRNFEIYLSGHSCVKRWKCNPRNDASNREKQEWAVVRTMIQRQLVQSRNDARDGKLISPRTKQTDHEYHLRMAQVWVERGYEFDSIKPQSWPKNERPKPHDTSFSDDFNRPLLGTSYTFVDPADGFVISANTVLARNAAAGVASGAFASVRYDGIDLSSSDMFGQIIRISSPSASRYIGVALRFQTADATYYGIKYSHGTGTSGIWKVINSVGTHIAVSNWSQSFPATTYGEADGSSISSTMNGGFAVSVTDTAIPAGTRFGFISMASALSGGAADDALFGDLVSASEIITHLQLNTESLSTIIPIKQTINEWLNTQSKNNLCLTSWDINLVQTNTIDVDHLASIINEKQISTSWEQAVRQQRQICSDWLTSTLTDSESSIDWFQILVDLEIIPISWRRDSSSDIKIHPKRIWITDINGRVWVAKKRRT